MEQQRRILVICVVGLSFHGLAAALCFRTGLITVTTANGPREISGWQNVGGCTCAEARARALNVDKRTVGQLTPNCDDSNPDRFQVYQHWGAVGSAWCVDPVTGNQNSETRFRGVGNIPCMPSAA